MTGRWWRHNWWGVLAMLPVLVALVVLGPTDAYEAWRDAEPREEIRPGADGWVDYAGGRIRLGDVSPAEVADGSGQPYPVPAGLRAWRVTVSVEAAGDPDTLLGCELQLEDGQGRRFGNDPQELADAYLDGEWFAGYQCSPPEEGVERFETVALFALPASAEPVALRVTHFAAMPRYVRFELA